jgi:hypothetical protein
MFHVCPRSISREDPIMKALLCLGCLFCFMAATSAALAEKPILPAPALLNRVSCELGPIAYDWNFALGPQGFSTVECDTAGTPVWEWGSTSIIPGAPAHVWGTILNGNYPNDSGAGLVSPMWTVDEQSYLVEVRHYFETESTYDGCNLTVHPYGAVWPPIGGYPTETISPSTSYYACCVDGEAGWTGSSNGWRVDCFDLSEYMQMQIAVEFDFGSDATVTAPGWYIARVRVGAPGPPHAVCCLPPTGECTIAPEEVCANLGGEWHPEWTSCNPNPCPIHAPVLKIGTWLGAEPWHNWAARDSIPLRLNMRSDPWDPITFVSFFWDSLGTWKPLGIDDDGTEPWFDTVGDAPPVGDGWSLLATLPDPMPSPTILFKAVVHTASRSEFEVLHGCDVDPAPPSLGRVNMQDWQTTHDDSIGFLVESNGTDIDSIVVWATRMEDVYEKGVPGISQQPHSQTHCVPTATAQCLKYFEVVHGDYEITGGLNAFTLVEQLAAIMATNQGPEPGTYLSDWIAGLAGWISDHGSGYTSRAYCHFDEDGWTWSERNWRCIRNELERCQDVLLGVFWEVPEGYEGGHAVTLNSIVNEPLPNGHIVINFKDPWTGDTAWGEVDPLTGRIENMGGAGGGGSARIGVTLIVSPAEAHPGSGGPGIPVYHGPNPYPDPVSVPIPELGPWFIHVVIVNTSGHAERITKIAVHGPAGAVDQDGALVGTFALGRCTPNPFWTMTEITYALATRERVSLALYDLTGRRVRTLLDEDVAPGVHRTTWDGRDDQAQRVAAGVYYVKLVASGDERSTRIVLVR